MTDPEAVNHSENFVDPNSGVNTQGIERAWLEAKEWYKRSRGSRKHLQSHLDEAAWRCLRSKEAKNGKLFSAFMDDMRAVYG